MVPVERPVTKPTVTYTILAITIFVYLLQELTRMGIAREPFLALSQMIFGPEVLQALLQNGWGDSLLMLLGGKINALIIAGQYWRLLTPALLHASLLHIGFNMYALYAIGSTLESYYGHQRFLVLYLVGALGGNVLSFLMTRGLSGGRIDRDLWADRRGRSLYLPEPHHLWLAGARDAHQCRFYRGYQPGAGLSPWHR